MPPEHLKRDGWQDQRILVVSADDQRLTWPEREFIRQIGDKLYGPKESTRRANARTSGQIVREA